VLKYVDLTRSWFADLRRISTENVLQYGWSAALLQDTGFPVDMTGKPVVPVDVSVLNEPKRAGWLYLEMKAWETRQTSRIQCYA
jgi:hypothetical protein